MSTPTYTKTGSKSQKSEVLAKPIFALEVDNFVLLKQAYETLSSNKRNNYAKTKTRSMVRGGGRKPWQQKGTGRARAGTIRSPIWRGGGITFGPSGVENYNKRLNRSSRQKALKQALSLAAKAKKIVVIEDIEVANAQTKELVALLGKLGLDRRITIVVAEVNDKLRRASNNLKNVRLVNSVSLNLVEVLDSDYLLLSKPGLKALETRLETNHA